MSSTGGHILPGYCDHQADRPSYSQLDFRRAKTARVNRTLLSDEERQKFCKSVDRETLNSIRESAKSIWLGHKAPTCPSERPTTYEYHYSEEKLRGHPPAQIRPSSPGRRNRPHPLQIFQTTRLHHVPGYHNANTKVHNEAYTFDDMAAATEQRERRQFRAKFEARPHTAAVLTYRQKYQGLENLPPREAQATEAWLKLANEEDQQQVLEKLKDLPPRRQDSRMSNVIPSLRGYMKKAGFKDGAAWARLHYTLGHPPPDDLLAAQELVQTDPASSPRPRLIYKPVPRRGDYSLHPEWPPTLPRHKLPCMC